MLPSLVTNRHQASGPLEAFGVMCICRSTSEETWICVPHASGNSGRVTRSLELLRLVVWCFVAVGPQSVGVGEWEGVARAQSTEREP